MNFEETQKASHTRMSRARLMAVAAFIYFALASLLLQLFVVKGLLTGFSSHSLLFRLAIVMLAIEFYVVGFALVTTIRYRQAHHGTVIKSSVAYFVLTVSLLILMGSKYFGGHHLGFTGGCVFVLLMCGPVAFAYAALSLRKSPPDRPADLVN